MSDSLSLSCQHLAPMACQTVILMGILMGKIDSNGTITWHKILRDQCIFLAASNEDSGMSVRFDGYLCASPHTSPASSATPGTSPLRHASASTKASTASPASSATPTTSIKSSTTTSSTCTCEVIYVTGHATELQPNEGDAR